MPLTKNRLLALLPRAEQRGLHALSEAVPLVLNTELHQPGQATRDVYFPTEGFLSLIASQPGTPRLEVGMVGNEGFVGAQLLLGVVHAPWLVLVQGEGSAARIPAGAFLAFLGGSAALRSIVQRYLGTVFAQLTASAPCLHFHEISQRLARWLLMTQDRAGTSQFKATHDFLSAMLGVRRASVTVAAGKLQRLGAVHYERGVVTVLDRGRLEHAACGCYQANQDAYRQIMGVRDAESPRAFNPPA